jgi:hypothetical protein
MRNAHEVFVDVHERKRSIGRPKRRCEENITFDLKKNRVKVWPSGVAQLV